jgi:hypothetical protein
MAVHTLRSPPFARYVAVIAFALASSAALGGALALVWIEGAAVWLASAIGLAAAAMLLLGVGAGLLRDAAADNLPEPEGD